uniref:Uncharacterized protein n=1 Tax=Aceria tosichella TaxID=561515 RepID=A0A6G1SGG4_9ACAR
MKLIIIAYILIIQAALLHICSLSARTRLRNTIEVRYNLDCHLPQCNSTDGNQSAVNLFQVISSNPDTPAKTNFIWSNIGGPPMIITTSSSQESSLNIEWDALLNPNNINDPKTEQPPSAAPIVQPQNSNTTITTPPPTPPPSPPKPVTTGFHFNVTQDAAIGLLVEKIILFDDTNKNGAFEKGKPHIEIDWGQIVWDQASKTTYHKDDFLKTHLRMKTNHKYLNGSLWIKLSIPRDYKADRQKEVPHLKLNSQSISVVIMVDGIQAPASFKNTRLAMTFVVVVQGPINQVAMQPASESLISDEYTPGVFRIKSVQFKTKQGTSTTTTPAPQVEDLSSSSDLIAEIDGKPAQSVSPVVSAPAFNRDKLGFLYWKEVAYTDRRKIISRTIDVFDSEKPMNMSTLPNISQPFYQFFMYEPQTGPKPEYNLFRFELIFGKGDSTYSATGFTDFSFVFGLGPAPQEQIFSFLVKVIIFVCFCLPLLVMLAGLGYLMLRRFRRNGDTELLLAAES